jgi:hypothetical protein
MKGISVFQRIVISFDERCALSVVDPSPPDTPVKVLEF